MVCLRNYGYRIYNLMASRKPTYIYNIFVVLCTIVHYFPAGVTIIIFIKAQRANRITFGIDYEVAKPQR